MNSEYAIGCCFGSTSKLLKTVSNTANMMSQSKMFFPMSDKAFTSIQCSVFSDLAAGNVGRVFAVDDT